MPRTARDTQGPGPKTGLIGDREVRPPSPWEDPGAQSERLARSGGLTSPARRMQSALGAEFAQANEHANRWPLRWTLSFVFATCGAFWLGLYFMVAALIG